MSIWGSANNQGGNGGGGTGDGDMKKSTYDTNNDGIVDGSERIESKAIVGSGTIQPGALLYFDDVALNAGRTEVTLADKDLLYANQALAVAKTGGTAGQEITITEYGLVFDDTSTYSGGQLLYLGNAGAVTDEKPTSGVVQIVGIVRYSNVDGDWLFDPELSKELATVLQDGEIVRYDAATDRFVGTGVIDNETEILSNKPLVAPSLKAGEGDAVGVIDLGNAISMRVGGEQVYLKDGVDGSIHGFVYQDVGDTLPKARVLGAFNEDIVRQADKTGVVNDPRFEITAPGNEQILSLTIEAWYPQTDVVLIAYKSGVEFYKNNIGSIPSGSEFKIDLLLGGGVPVDVFGGTVYEIEIVSSNGTLSLKGDDALQIPFYAVTYYDFDLQDLVTADLPINREVLISQSSTALSQEPTALDVPIIIEFGPAFGDASNPIELDASGVFTVNESGTYFVKPYVHYGRTTTAGEVDLFTRLVVNGAQQGNSIFSRLDDDDTVIPSGNEILIELNAGDTFYYELVRDSNNGGINNGGLFAGEPLTTGWASAPCASITISRLVGNAATLQSDGDVVGPGSSSQDEIPTFANSSGKEIKASSDVSAINGTVKRLTPNADLNLESNGTGSILVDGETIAKEKVNAIAHVSDNSTYTTISSINNYVQLVFGNGFEVTGSSDFSADTVRVTYTGSGFAGRIKANIYLKTFFGTVSDAWRWDLRMAKNGTVFGGFVQTSEMKEQDRATLFIDNPEISLSNGDTIQIYIKQLAGVTNEYPVAQNVSIEFEER